MQYKKDALISSFYRLFCFFSPCYRTRYYHHHITNIPFKGPKINGPATIYFWLFGCQPASFDWQHAWHLNGEDH